MIRDHLTIHQLPGTKVVTLYCGHCAGALHLALPIRLDEIVEAARQFTERHKQCKKA